MAWGKWGEVSPTFDQYGNEKKRKRREKMKGKKRRKKIEKWKLKRNGIGANKSAGG